MTATFHIFALNADLDLRHTNLTRARGETPDLPPLADWLGVEAINTDDIELFPVADLGEMSLSDYVTAAFTPAQPIAGETRARLDALDGSVLLVPDWALRGALSPGPQATEIAAIPLAEADHGGDLPKAAVTPPPSNVAPAPRAPAPSFPGWMLWAVLAGVVLLAALLVF